jgi:hypothetical protein
MSKYIEVEVDLSEFDTEDLVEELGNRGYHVGGDSLLQKIWRNRREGKDYQAELDEYLYQVLGKIV